MKEHYSLVVKPGLQAKFGFKNPMLVPKIKKVVLNYTSKEALQNSKVLDEMAADIGAIAGQRPVVTKAKKSIAGFKVRKGQPIGVAVTLRNDNMYEFLNRLINVVLPRTKDFKGLSRRAFDGRGNYTFGIKEHSIFPEVRGDRAELVRGLSVSIETSANCDEHSLEMLTLFGVPFRK